MSHIAVVLTLFALVAVVFTHFAVGGVLHRSRGWRAWQPMRGSHAFVVLQACAWTSAAIGVASLIACAAISFDALKMSHAFEGEGDGRRARRMAAAALSWSALGGSIASESLVAISLAFFDDGSRKTRSKMCDDTNVRARESEGEGVMRESTRESTTLSESRRETSAAPRTMVSVDVRSVAHVMHMLAVLQLIHAPQYFICAVLCTGYAIGGLWTSAVIVVSYSLSFLNTRRYEQGKKSWLAFQTWTRDVVEQAAVSWYGSVRVVCLDEVGDEIALTSMDNNRGDESGPLVFAYHPHGLIPTGSIWMSMTREFRERFKGLKPVTLAASALFRAPIVRELAAWVGVRSVSTSIFETTLRTEGAVVVVPGGQREMAEHIGGVNEEEIVLCTKHRGFIRIAIQERARLCPIVVFGESASYTNLWRSTGRFFYKKFRMSVPLFAVGYGGVLPLPARVPLTFVIGKPVSLPEPDENGAARPEDIERVHKAYYSSIETMFEKHKAASGFPNLRLKFKHD